LYDYGEHWPLVTLTVGTALIAIVTFGSLVGAMLPFILKALNFDPATASAPFVATLVFHCNSLAEGISTNRY
jgi:magnesium transporter